MAKKQTADPVEPEEISQEIPDEEPARGAEDEPADAAESNGASGASKTDLIREALQAGHTKPAVGVAYIKQEHGVDIDPKYFSIVKGKLGKAGEAPARARAVEAPRRAAASPAPTTAPGAVPTSLFDDLRQLRQIKDRYGDDFQKIVDAIG